MKELEKQLKALANKRRLEILRILKNKKELDVGTIAAMIQLSFKATSKHLSILYAQDMIEREQRSIQMFYSLAKNHKPATRSILRLI